MTEVSFLVLGLPVQQGSKNAWVNPHTGKAVMVEKTGRRLKDWRADIKIAFLAATSSQQRDTMVRERNAVSLTVVFAFPRPASHYGSGKNADRLKGSAPESHVQTPDLDKLLRSVLDALTGVAYLDDRFVDGISACRVWASDLHPPGASINLQWA